jgi:hypothetical protein
VESRCSGVDLGFHIAGIDPTRIGQDRPLAGLFRLAHSLGLRRVGVQGQVEVLQMIGKVSDLVEDAALMRDAIELEIKSTLLWRVSRY